MEAAPPTAAARPQTLRFYGIEYQVDVARIRVALITRIQQAEEAGGRGLHRAAQQMGFTRQTLWRFMHGEAVSLPTLLAILKFVGLKFEEVARTAVAA